MRITFFFLLILLPLNCIAASISSPIEGAVVRSGESFQVRIDTIRDEQIEKVMISTLNSNGLIVVNKPPFEVTFVASDNYIGNETIDVDIKYANGNKINLQRNIMILLKDGITLQNITYYENRGTFVIDTESENDVGSLYGTYSDGIERELPNPANPLLEFSSDDPSIVEVDNTGRMYSLKLGKTFITIKSGDVLFKLPVKVFVTLEPPTNFRAVATQTDIQLSWELSPNDPKWITEYKIYRSERSDGLYDILVATVPKGSTTFTDTTALLGKTYYYSVQAISTTANDVSQLTVWKSGKLLDATRAPKRGHVSTLDTF